MPRIHVTEDDYRVLQRIARVFGLEEADDAVALLVEMVGESVEGFERHRARRRRQFSGELRDSFRSVRARCMRRDEDDEEEEEPRPRSRRAEPSLRPGQDRPKPSQVNPKPEEGPTTEDMIEF